MIDFTGCTVNKFKAYGGGNGNKLSIIYQDEMYMLKLAPKDQGKGINATYTNASISEYLCCHICESMGFNTQKTLIGKYFSNGKYKDAVACKDFEVDGYTLMEFYKLKNAFLDSDSNGYGTELSEVLETISNQKLINQEYLNNFFWEMFITDAFLGNFDRHNGNWGLLVNQNLQKAEIAPIYDCGSCLYPQIDEKTIEKVLSDPNEQDQRIFVFPASALKYNDKKINYFDFISSNINQDCTDALHRMLPRIDMQKVEHIIASSESSPSRKNFYITILNQRKDKILDFSLKRIKEYENKISSLQYSSSQLHSIGEATFGWTKDISQQRIGEFKKLHVSRNYLGNYLEVDSHEQI